MPNHPLGLLCLHRISVVRKLGVFSHQTKLQVLFSPGPWPLNCEADDCCSHPPPKWLHVMHTLVVPQPCLACHRSGLP